MTWLLKSEDDAVFAQDVRGRSEFSDGQASVDAVLAGCGPSQLPDLAVGKVSVAGALVPVLEQYAGAEIPIHAVWPQSGYMTPKVRVLIDALVLIAKEPVSRFEC